MATIDKYVPVTGRRMKEDGTTINMADTMAAVYNPSGVIRVGNGPFEASLLITRPSNATPYSIQDIINSGANTTLPYFDLSAFGANREIIINFMNLMSNYAAAATKLTCDCHLLPVNNPIADCTDNNAYNPTFTAMQSRVGNLTYADPSVDQPVLGNYGYTVARWQAQQVIAHTDSNGYLYLAPICTNAYTPASGELLWSRITGFVQ